MSGLLGSSCLLHLPWSLFVDLSEADTQRRPHCRLLHTSTMTGQTILDTRVQRLGSPEAEVRIWVGGSCVVCSQSWSFKWVFFSPGKREGGEGGIAFDSEEERQQWEEDQRVSMTLCLAQLVCNTRWNLHFSHPYTQVHGTLCHQRGPKGGQSHLCGLSELHEWTELALLPPLSDVGDLLRAAVTACLKEGCLLAPLGFSCRGVTSLGGF